MKFILVGSVLIAVGLLRGDSVFLGDFTVESWLFDGLGSAAVVLGLVRLYRKRRQPSP